MRRIAALVPYVLGRSPGQRVRIEAWAHYLEQSGWQVDFYPFEDEALRDVLYRPGKRAAKGARMVSCWVRQFRRVMQRPPCDLVFIYREAALAGPALLERIAARWKVPVIFDLDDPVFLPYRSPTNSWFSLLKFSRKTYTIFRLSDRVTTHNRDLADHVAQYAPSVSVIPNFVDTERYQPGTRASDGVVRLVWVGSHGNLPSLVPLAEPLRRLQSRHRAPLRIIGAGQIDLPGVDAEFVPWSASTEIEDLQAGDIGLAPFLDVAWNRWKTPFKALQYMAVGIPVVARRMAAASELVEDGVNGFLVETADEWHDRLQLLVSDEKLRVEMGRAARAAAVEKFSAHVHVPKMLAVFEDVLQADRRPTRPPRYGR